jgi:hypothetical protein
MKPYAPALAVSILTALAPTSGVLGEAPIVAALAPTDGASGEVRPSGNVFALAFSEVAAEPSPSPASSEWDRAEPSWPGPRRICYAQRVREWLRVTCETDLLAMRLLAGTPEGISFSLDEDPRLEGFGATSGTVIFPLRPGDRRVIEVTSRQMDGYRGMGGEGFAFMISEAWVPGEEAAIVTVD